MTVEFSNTKASVWNSIQAALTEAGFIVANVSALDKKQGSFKAVTTPTAVKQDLVISVYKPNGGFEKRFLNEATSEEGVWDFVRTHLKYLPVTKKLGADFVSDEASAIQWLRNLIKPKPQTFQDINPQFMKELGGWQKHEKALELSELLKENFLLYDGKDDVSSQIHSYLSSNFKELRNLGKDDLALKAKAKDRWYVPDPNKAGDLEKLRERTLMREFEEYREAKQKRLKVFRFEAVRAGFKKAWQERNYSTIIAVARKIPDNILQEDPKLLMWYDQAVTRLGVK